MSIGLIGYKCGMTRFFESNGLVIPVTVVQFYSNFIIKVKSCKTDGYSAIQVSACTVKEKNLSKSLLGLYKKIGVNCAKYIYEFRVNENELNSYGVRNEIAVSIFDVEKYVTVTGVSKGRGFSGVVRRHNFSMQRATHGNSRSHRVPGSIGQCQTPGRVFKGKKMPGCYGNERITIKNLEIVKIYAEKRVVLLKGGIPGAVGSKVIVKKI